MARKAKYDILFEPVPIGPKTLRNRFFQVPHSTGFGSDHPYSQARFRATRAEGGWAAVCIEISSIDPETDRNPVPIPVRLWDDSDVENLSLVCEEAHAHGALVGLELWHSGAHVDGTPSRTVPGAPSQLPSDAYPHTYPRELTASEIAEVQQLYVAAAIRARAAGCDIVYVYGAHGYLPMQFLSSFYNQRDDDYGGTLENRARFWIETLAAVRHAIGTDTAIAARVGIDPDGLVSVNIDEAVAFVRLADHLVDLWDINTSAIASPWMDMRPSRLGPQGYQLEFTRHVRAATDKPIVGVSRVTDPDLMVEIIRSGAWDLIGGARPSIADPFLPHKIEQGRPDEIRECIGCNICLSRALTVNHIACTQNATAGEEYRRAWHPERFDPTPNPGRDVLIVGAGPAGMECAIVLAKRGFRRVHLLDSSDDLGGHLRTVTRLPGLAEWARLIDYRRSQIAALKNIQLILNQGLTATEILEYGAELVVLATGATWARDGLNHLTHAPIPGSDADHVLTPDQILDQLSLNGSRTLVYDCEGYYMGAAIAEHAARQGAHVQLVTPHPVIGPYLDRTFEGWPTRRTLHDLGIKLLPDTTLTQIDGHDCAITQYPIDQTVTADHVVLVTARQSQDTLVRELGNDHEALQSKRIEAVYAIGDCVAPRLIADSIFDGHRLAREIDSDHPVRALPYRRERGHRHHPRKSGLTS